MSKRTRTIIFIICVFLFLLISPSVILYSQGYRVDFEKKKIVQIGAFSFKVLPKSADVYLNDDFNKKTSGITGSVFIENLLPKNYEVEIKKEGYYSWEKTLEVKEKEVIEAKNIILFPQNPDFKIFDQKLPEIEPSATSSDKKGVVESNKYEIWVNFPNEEKKIFLTRFSEEIGSIFWLTNDYLIFNVGNKIKIAEIDDRDRLNIVDLAEFESPEIFWDGNNQKLYVLSNKKLYVSESLLP